VCNGSSECIEGDGEFFNISSSSLITAIEEAVSR
jgi:uncharacterized Fe-S cluster protein YjdI